MKTGTHRYKYIRQIKGSSHYGEVEIEINWIDSDSIVIDDCNWKTLKQSYPNFKETEVLKTWKQSAMKAAQYILDNYDLPESIEIKIKDVVGLYVDTVPAHLGAAMTIGIFDLIKSPLNPEDLKAIDDFVSNNRDIELIPNYKNMAITKAKKS